MSNFLTRNRLVLAKAEVTSGIDPVPAPASDAVLVEEPRSTPNVENEQTDEVNGSLERSLPIVGGGHRANTLRFFAKGSGVPGTEPEFTPYLQAAAFGLTTLAADSAGTAQAGAAGSITLAVGAPATDLSGFVIETTGGTGSGQTAVIVAYNTATKLATVTPNWAVVPNATTTYAVRAGNLFTPSSTNLKTITDYLYKLNSGGGDAILTRLTGAAANLSFAIQARGTGKFTASLRGVLNAPQSVVNPAAGVFDTTRPRPLIAAKVALDGATTCFRNLTLDCGNEIVQPDCPGAAFGFDPARVVDSLPTGRINPHLVTLATRNPFLDMMAGGEKWLWVSYGEVLGNKVSLLQKIMYTGQEDDDLDGIAADGLPFAIAPGSRRWLFY